MGACAEACRVTGREEGGRCSIASAAAWTEERELFTFGEDSMEKWATEGHRLSLCRGWASAGSKKGDRCIYLWEPTGPRVSRGRESTRCLGKKVVGATAGTLLTARIDAGGLFALGLGVSGAWWDTD